MYGDTVSDDIIKTVPDNEYPDQAWVDEWVYLLDTDPYQDQGMYDGQNIIR